MPVLRFVGIVARHDVSGSGELLLNKIVIRTMTAWITPRPHIRLLRALEYVGSRSTNFRIGICFGAPGFGVRPAARMRTGMRPNLVTVIESFPQPGPQW